jgi:hypothetical protein
MAALLLLLVAIGGTFATVLLSLWWIGRGPRPPTAAGPSE